MRKLKVITSIVLALIMLSTSFAFSTIVSAADKDTAATGQPTSLQNNIADGVILHALCWSYADIEKNIPAIAAAGYSAVQTSPVQQPKDINTSTDISGQWWKLYQPVSLSIANNSWVGTSTQLTSLCNTAHQYGVKIICDIVSNHLGASSEDKTPKKLAKEVQTYEPTLWGSNGSTQGNQYFHQDFSAASDGNNVTTGCLTQCPDLNTGNDYVQGRVKSLLRSCIDCGVDGFRFDAAKHIETPSDGSNASSYWTNVLGDATSYASSSKNKTLFYYGEILNGIGNNRPSSNYTNLANGKFRITDNGASASIRGAVTGHNASAAQNASLSKSGGASHAVLWAESHDTYLGNAQSEVTTDVSDQDIVKTWALVAARGNSTALYFARTNNMQMGTAATNTNYKSVAVAEVNKFHNNYVGQSEKLGSSGSIAYVARGTTGIVLVNCNGTSTSASVSGTGLANGTYTDMITGSKFTVSGGTVSGNIGSTGVAVVTTGSTTPAVFASKESQTFEGETITTQLSLSNATSGTYQLDNYAPVTFTGSPTIRMGSDYNYGDTFTLTLTATDGSQTTTTKYKYTKKAAASSGIYVILPASVVNKGSNGKKWTTPVFCYVYDEVNTTSYPKYANAAWPGAEMQYDATNQVYYYEVHSDTCLKTASASSTATVDSYDLAHSTRTRVIVSDSAKTAGGVSAGAKCPAGDITPGLLLNSSSHKYTNLSKSDASAWETTTMKPGQETPVAATEVKKGGATTPSSESTPTTPSSDSTPTTPSSSGDTYYYGDANMDKSVNINDVTTIQLHLVKSALITDATALQLADVTADNKVTIQDANYIQRNLAGMSNTGRVKQAYSGGSTPTNPTSQTTPTSPSSDTTPTTPAGTFTLYVKTYDVAWLSADGAEPYVLDNNSGTAYQMVKDQEAYPDVFTAEVPDTISSVTFFRATAPTAVHYNEIDGLTVSKTNNCINVYIAEAGLEATLGAKTEPYVADQKPTDGVSTIYVNNNKGWSAVYIYGWSKGLNSQTYAMTNIGNNIWKFDLPETIYGDSPEFFLFKGVETGWDPQTANQKITGGNDYFDLNAGTWSKYSG